MTTCPFCHCPIPALHIIMHVQTGRDTVANPGMLRMCQRCEAVFFEPDEARPDGIWDRAKEDIDRINRRVDRNLKKHFRPKARPINKTLTPEQMARQRREGYSTYCDFGDYDD